MRLVIELQDKSGSGVFVALVHEGAKQATAKEKQLAGALVEVITAAVPRIAELLGSEAHTISTSAASAAKPGAGSARFYVEPTSSGRFAVIERGEELKTLGYFESESAALTIAAALNNGPVKSVTASGRWN